MRTLLGAFFFISVFSTYQCLKCWKCEGTVSQDKDEKVIFAGGCAVGKPTEEDCAETDKFCFIEVVVPSIKRGCAAECVDKEMDASKNVKKCCDKDLCNADTSGDVAIKAHTSLLAVMAALPVLLIMTTEV